MPGCVAPWHSYLGGCAEGVCFGRWQREWEIRGIPMPGLAVWLVRAGAVAEGMCDSGNPSAWIDCLAGIGRGGGIGIERF